MLVGGSVFATSKCEVAHALGTMSLPYRSPAESAPRAPRERESIDASVAPVVVLFWVASGARVVLGIARHEVFATEATLALISFVLVPWMNVERIRRRPRTTGTS